MSIINLGFDMKDIESDFNPIEKGDYLASIDSIEEVESRGGHSMVKIEFTIVEGPCSRRKIFKNYCVNHPNQVASGIAKKQLTDVAYLTGTYKQGTSFTKLNTDDLINKTIVLKIDIDEKNPKYNTITGYKPSGPLNDNSAERIMEELDSNRLPDPAKPLEVDNDIPF